MRLALQFRPTTLFAENLLRSVSINTVSTPSIMQTTNPISPVRAIAMILANGVLRLQQRQKGLDNFTEQSVHHRVLTPKGETR